MQSLSLCDYSGNPTVSILHEVGHYHCDITNVVLVGAPHVKV